MGLAQDETLLWLICRCREQVTLGNLPHQVPDGDRRGGGCRWVGTDALSSAWWGPKLHPPRHLKSGLNSWPFNQALQKRPYDNRLGNGEDDLEVRLCEQSV